MTPTIKLCIELRIVEANMPLIVIAARPHQRRRPYEYLKRDELPSIMRKHVPFMMPSENAAAKFVVVLGIPTKRNKQTYGVLLGLSIALSPQKYTTLSIRTVTHHIVSSWHPSRTHSISTTTLYRSLHARSRVRVNTSPAG